MSERTKAEAAKVAAIGQQELAQDAKDAAVAAQLLAEKAKNDAISARNTAAENSGQAEQLYATFLAQYESIDARLTALEQKQGD